MLEDAGTQKPASLNIFVLFLQVGACGLVFIPVSSIIKNVKLDKLAQINSQQMDICTPAKTTHLRL